MTKPTLLLTGGSGYLGQHLAPHAAELYSLVTTYHTRPTEVTAGQAIPLDLTDRDGVLQQIRQLQPQAIIHAAAINPGQGDGAAMMRVNADRLAECGSGCRGGGGAAGLPLHRCGS